MSDAYPIQHTFHDDVTSAVPGCREAHTANHEGGCPSYRILQSVFRWTFTCAKIMEHLVMIILNRDTKYHTATHLTSRASRVVFAFPSPPCALAQSREQTKSWSVIDCSSTGSMDKTQWAPCTRKRGRVRLQADTITVEASYLLRPP